MKSLRAGTFFEKSHLPLDTIFELMYFWSREEDFIEKLMHELDIGSQRTIVDWRNFCRDVCAKHYLRNPIQIGGMLC